MVGSEVTELLSAVRSTACLWGFEMTAAPLPEPLRTNDGEADEEIVFGLNLLLGSLKESSFFTAWGLAAPIKQNALYATTSSIQQHLLFDTYRISFALQEARGCGGGCDGFD